MARNHTIRALKQQQQANQLNLRSGLLSVLLTT